MILYNPITLRIQYKSNFANRFEFFVTDARRVSRVYGARRRTSSAPEVCIIRVGCPFPASWDSLPRTTASDNRAGPFKHMSRPFFYPYGVLGTHEIES